MSHEYPLRAEDAAWRTVGGELIVVSAGSANIVALNGTAALVWEMADGVTSVDEMADALAEAFDVAAPDAEHDIEEFLGVLDSEGLLSAERAAQ